MEKRKHSVFFKSIVVIAFAFFVFLLYIFDQNLSIRGHSIPQAVLDLRHIKNALESFYIDHGVYPSSSPSGSILEASITVGGQSYFLTTPKPYAKSSLWDAYSLEKAPYRYFLNGTDGFFLLSNGPDGDIDLSLVAIESYREKRNTVPIQDKMYDSSNGITSDGDIFWISP